MEVQAIMEGSSTTSATTVATVAMAAVSASIPTVAPAAVHTTVSKHLPCMALALHAYIMCDSLRLLNLATSVCVRVRTVDCYCGRADEVHMYVLDGSCPASLHFLLLLVCICVHVCVGSLPCQNGGQCRLGLYDNSEYCECPYGYSGLYCEQGAV